MGIGIHTEASRNNIYKLNEFTNKKIHAFAVGDYHSVLIASDSAGVDTIEGSAKGRDCSNSGTDIYSWGLNTHS